jgi:hypothetical protein
LMHCRRSPSIIIIRLDSAGRPHPLQPFEGCVGSIREIFLTGDLRFFAQLCNLKNLISRGQCYDFGNIFDGNGWRKPGNVNSKYSKLQRKIFRAYVFKKIAIFRRTLIKIAKCFVPIIDPWFANT